jgi:hypothetical protein
MQIHELTRGKPVQEASVKGAVGGLGAVVGTTLGKAVVQGLAAGSGMDANVIAPGGLSSNGDRAGTAGQYTQQQAQPFATQIQKAWTEMVQAQLKNSGATNLAQIDSADNDKLKTQLTAMINDMINANSYGGSSYENLASNIAADNPEAQQAAKMVSVTITKAINDIFTATLSPTAANNAAATSKMFLTLAQSGILPAQHLLKFYPRSGAASNSATAAKSAPLTPGAQKLATALKADMASLPAAQANAQANPTAAIIQFKELMGLK